LHHLCSPLTSTLFAISLLSIGGLFTRFALFFRDSKLVERLTLREHFHFVRVERLEFEETLSDRL
jgi:hypothetical protein